MEINKKLKEIKEKLSSIDIGDLPDNEIESDIFSELDILTSHIVSNIIKFEKENRICWDSKILDESVSSLKNFVSQRGEVEFKKNKKLVNWYNLCIEAIQIMKEVNEKKQDEN